MPEPQPVHPETPAAEELGYVPAVDRPEFVPPPVRPIEAPPVEVGGVRLPAKNITEGARRALLAAEYEARLDRRAFVLEAHLLLGLLDQDDATAELLREVGITVPEIRTRSEVFAAFRQIGDGSERILLSPLTKDAVTEAVGEASRRGRPVGTEHLLFGLLRDPRDWVPKNLEDLGLDLTALRSRCWELLARTGPLPEALPDAGYPAPKRLLPHGSAVLGVALGACGVGLAYLILARMVTRRGYTMEPILGVFHASWTAVILLLGVALVFFPSRRRTGEGLLLLAAVGLVATLLNI